MLILALRTDNPLAEIGLYDGEQQVAYEQWQAHRQLGATIHQRIHDLLKGHGKDWADIGGIVALEGPGSFTGLRIGLSVVNALGSSYKIPVVGSTGDNWIIDGIAKLASEPQSVVLPAYGSPVHITEPKR